MQSFPIEYSSLSASGLLQLCINNYNLSRNSTITFLKRGFNDTYLISSASKKSILRVYKHNWRSIESIQSEIELLNYLNIHNVSVAFPIMDTLQNSIQPIDAPEGIRYAVLFSYAEGVAVKKMTPEQAYLLGAETGKIHTLMQGFTVKCTAHDYDVHSQFKIILATLQPILINHTLEYNLLLQLRNKFVAVFEATDKSQLQIGICHGDLQSENFHITAENKFTFFDFDFFGKGHLVYDIAVFAWYDHKNKPTEIINAFIQGYKTQHTISDTEIALIPWFSALRALFQMRLFCEISDGKQLPLWPAQQVANFLHKVEKWINEKT
ncbi:MAG: phosphotransferase [Bacteroidia bacterium]